ncbi:MAG: ABC transporter permease [Pseudomonadota bacterium]
MSSDSLDIKRIKAMALKEMYHILRDPFTLILALGLPLFLVLIFGFAIDLDVKNIRLLVDDRDQSFTSRTLVDLFRNSEFFKVAHVPASVDPEKYISAERAKGVLVIEPGLEKNVHSGKDVAIQIALDGADNSTVGSMLNYLVGIQERSNQKMTAIPVSNPIALKTRFLYNPELNSQKFIVPGLIVVVMAIVSVLLTALTVAREWENGPMELLLSTPLKPLEIIIGKLIPYFIISIISTMLIYAIARVGFAIPFRGSLLIYILGLLLFICAYLAQGLLISVATRKQVISMQISMITGLLPSVLLSGFIFPVESMPRFFQVLTGILPARWFVEIGRDCFLKGSDWGAMKIPLLALLLLNIILISLATKKFRRDLEP